MALAAGKAAQPFFRFFESLNAIMFKAVGVVILLAPIAVFALLAKEIWKFGFYRLEYLGGYFLCVFLGLMIHAAVTLPIMIRLFAKRSPIGYFLNMREALALAFSTAILKYRLADLGLFVKHGVTALTLTFFSLAVFVLVNLTLRNTLGLPGIDNRVFTVLAGILVFLLYPTLRQVVGGIVDRAFYLGHYDYRRTMLEFARELNSERELLPLMLKFHDRIGRTLPLMAPSSSRKCRLTRGL